VRDKKHPSHSFSPLYKGFSEDYVRDGLKIMRSLQKKQIFGGWEFGLRKLGVYRQESPTFLPGFSGFPAWFLP
jgi:hypothetical protein